jgi:hypothetical protein
MSNNYKIKNRTSSRTLPVDPIADLIPPPAEERGQGRTWRIETPRISHYLGKTKVNYRSPLQEPAQKMSNYKIIRTLSGIEIPNKSKYFGKANHCSHVTTTYGKRFIFSSIILAAILVYKERDRLK